MSSAFGDFGGANVPAPATDRPEKERQDKVVSDLLRVAEENAARVRQDLERGVVNYEALRNIADVALRLHVVGSPSEAATVGASFVDLTREARNAAKAWERAEAVHQMDELMENVRETARRECRIDGASVALLLEIADAEGDLDEVLPEVNKVISALEDRARREMSGFFPQSCRFSPPLNYSSLAYALEAQTRSEALANYLRSVRTPTYVREPGPPIPYKEG